MSDAVLQFDFSPFGKAGMGNLLIRSGNRAIYTCKADIADSNSREDVVKTIISQFPALDRGEISQRLIDLAAGQFSAAQSAAEKTTQAHALAKLGDGFDYFHDEEGIAYATVPVETTADGPAHRETHPIRAAGFRQWLAYRHWKTHGRTAGGQAMQDAIAHFEAQAGFGGPCRPVAVRVARHDGAIYLDLANDSWEMVRITADGWNVVTDGPVRFVRRRGMESLPHPERGESIDVLRPLVNAAIDNDWRLMVAWLVGTLHPTGPYPVLAVNGEQGSAKSTTCRMLRRLIDPNAADLRSAPREERDLMIAARNAWIIGFDNLSTIPHPLSDALCRLATGGGFTTRELYTNDGEALFRASRPILFNGIEELATRPDLLERAIVLNLPPISEDRRRTEADLWTLYGEIRPAALGALLDAVSAAMRNGPTVKLDRRPRMADFAQWVTAAEPAIGWPPGTFASVYSGNHETANELALESAAIGPAVVGLMEAVDHWEGTAKELLTELETDRRTDLRTRTRQDWPKTPKALSNALRRIAPTLRRLGIEVVTGEREGKARRRLIRLVRLGERPSEPSAPPAEFDFGPTATDGADGPTGPRMTNRPPDPPNLGMGNTPADGADDADGITLSRSAYAAGM